MNSVFIMESSLLLTKSTRPTRPVFGKLDTYEKRFKKGLEPENFDKEFLRLWYAKKGYKGDGTPPPMSKELIVSLAQRYIGVYEKITGKKFKPFVYPIKERIIRNLKKAGII